MTCRAAHQRPKSCSKNIRDNACTVYEDPLGPGHAPILFLGSLNNGICEQGEWTEGKRKFSDPKSQGTPARCCVPQFSDLRSNQFPRRRMTSLVNQCRYDHESKESCPPGPSPRQHVNEIHLRPVNRNCNSAIIPFKTSMPCNVFPGQTLLFPTVRPSFPQTWREQHLLI